MKLPEPQVETTLFSRDSSTQFYYTESQLREALAQQEDVMRQALLQLNINRTNFRKGPSKSICKMLAGGNDDAIRALEDALK